MNLDKITFRKMKPDEYEVLINLWDAAGLHYRPNGRDKKENLLSELNNTQESFIFAEYRNGIIGSILVSHDGRKGWINRLVVHPQFRKKGVAAKLIEKAENFLAENKIEIFACLIEDWNQISMDLFQKAGYQRFDDIIYFTKKLHPEV